MHLRKPGMSVAFPENKIDSDKKIPQSQTPWSEIILIMYTVSVHLKWWQSK